MLALYSQSLGKIFQILAPKEVIVSVPYLTELTLLLLKVSAFRKLYVKFLNLKTSEMGTECTPVSSCVIEVDVLLSQTAFYDVKTGEESFVIQN